MPRKKTKKKTATKTKERQITRFGKEVQDELYKLWEKHGEKLKPEHVARFAEKNPKSAIHQWLEANHAWDTDWIQREWLKHLCRRAIMQVQCYLPDGYGKPIRTRAFVSLPSDQRLGNGYTHIRKVLTNDEMLAEYEERLVGDLESVKRRHTKLLTMKKYRPLLDAISDVLSED